MTLLKRSILLFIFITMCIAPKCQSVDQSYDILIKKAFSFYQSKEYLNSALTYSKAFTLGKKTPDDLYNGACSWALAKRPDSSFTYLFLLATKLKYHNYSHIIEDSDLNSLHKDIRWVSLLDKIKSNKKELETSFITPLVIQLDSIYENDQKYRLQLDTLYQQYGKDSKEVKSLDNLIIKTDSNNLNAVKLILNHYGWLGPESVGEKGNSAFFLVIQHADEKVIAEYLPTMRNAVKNKKAMPKHLALLEDRVAIYQGKKQIYGSQLRMNEKTKKFYVLPIEDPENVDKRRAVMGLMPMAEYVKYWGISWDVQEHKKAFKTN